jgi:AP2 domain.
MPYIVDITNQKFGHLTALCKTAERKGGEIVWECQCDCKDKNIVYRTFDWLKRTKDYNLHCGCKNNEAEKMKNGKISDLTGKVFGQLTALRPTDKRSNRSVIWECQCSCGSTVHRTAVWLKRTKDHNLHCGCKNNEAEKMKNGKISDLTGKIFGYLTALRPTDRRSNRSVIWECQCSCGNVIFRPASSLQGKYENQSCGCMLSEIAQEKNRNNFHFVDGTRIESIKSQKLLFNNKSGVRGVHFDSNTGKWRAVIYFKSRQIHLGLFMELDDATKARKNAEDLFFAPVIEGFERAMRA